MHKLFVYMLRFSLLITTMSIIHPVYARHHSRNNQLARCHTGEYECVEVKRHESWHSLFPDERERDIVMRVNHTNRSLYPGMVISVPRNLASGNALDYSPLPHQLNDVHERTIVFDPKVYAWGAYDSDGTLVKWGPASGGSDWCRDLGHACHTKPGSYRIYSLGSSNCVSTIFPLPDGGAPMPYCMFFHGGQALHGSPGEVAYGNISHGCVRLFVQDAEWIRYDFAEYGTRVIVLPYH